MSGKKQAKAPIQVEWDEIPLNPSELPFIVLAEGLQGAGKTHFAMTFPEPIFILDTENRADKVASKFAGVKPVYRKRISSFNEIRQTLVQKIFEYPGGTIVIDSGSDLQMLAELEYLEEAKVEKVYPTYLWVRIWEKIDGMIATIRDRGFHCVITGRLRDEYIDDGKKTGNLVLEGYRKLPYRVDIHLRLLGNNRAEVYKNGFRNSPIENIKVLEAPSYSVLMEKLIVAQTPEPSDLKRVEVIKPKSRAKKTTEAKHDGIAEGNHPTPERNPSQNGSTELGFDGVATKDQVIDAYKYGLGLGLSEDTLKMILYDIRGGAVEDHEKLSDGMTMGEISAWREGMETIAVTSQFNRVGFEDFVSR